MGGSIASQMLEGAARPEVSKKNREALYDTADVLEKLARSPLPKGVKALCLVDDPDAKAPEPVFSLPPWELPRPLAASPAKQKSKMKKVKNRKAKKAKKANGETGVAYCMSPLVLPAAAIV